jgi:nucleoside-diphosphate-sugar epimerase
VRVFVTGGNGVLGRALLPLLAAEGHEVRAPAHQELDLFDAPSVTEAVAGAEAIYHLATRIPPRERMGEPKAWAENDRLRTEVARVLVDAALAAGTEVFVQPSITFVYPRDGEVDEETPIGEVRPQHESSLAAEREAARFADAGRRGVVLRFGSLDGPGTDYQSPDPRADASVHVEDAGRALLAALNLPSGVYNVVRDGQRVSNARFRRAAGWEPVHRGFPVSSSSRSVRSR